jgi:hypothetical protein
VQAACASRAKQANYVRHFTFRVTIQLHAGCRVSRKLSIACGQLPFPHAALSLHDDQEEEEEEQARCAGN